MLELLFQGFIECIYGLILECWEYFASVLFDLMSLDFAYLREHMPVIDTIRQIMLGVGWALLIGNLVFQATRGMAAGLGFDAEDPKLLFIAGIARTAKKPGSGILCQASGTAGTQGRYTTGAAEEGANALSPTRYCRNRAHNGWSRNRCGGAEARCGKDGQEAVCSADRQNPGIHSVTSRSA